MRNVIILGSGGCAAEVTFYIEDNNSNSNTEEKINILGYIDYAENIKDHYDRYNFKAPLLGDIDSYTPSQDEEVLIAIANNKVRSKMIESLKNKNAKIGSFIHKSSIIPKNADLGIGIIVYPFCIIEKYAKIGNYNILTTSSFISHDCVIGDNNFFSTTGIAGNVKIGNNNYFGIRSTVIPGVIIGNNNIIQAGMVLDKHVKDDTTVFYRYKEQVLAIPKPQ
jgi:sugar O-acyltransferase (sialic acid O-acetyltransferase NeuD family)